jgi:hypothetical protein
MSLPHRVEWFTARISALERRLTLWYHLLSDHERAHPEVGGEIRWRREKKGKVKKRRDKKG